MPDKKPSLKSNFIFNLISEFIILAVPLFTAPYLARTLQETGNGEFAFSQSVVQYFILAANLGFGYYGQREIAKYQENPEMRSKVFWEIFLVRLVLTLVSLGVFLSLVLFNVFDLKYKLIMLVLAANIFGVAIDLTFFYQGIENFRSITIRTVAIRLVGLICTYLLVKSTEDVWVYAMIVMGTAVGASVVMWFPMYKFLVKVPVKELRPQKHLWPAFLAFLPMLAVSVYTTVDKTMIGYLSSNPDYDNGCYEYAYKLNSIMLTAVTVITPIMIPRNAHDYAAGEHEKVRRHLLLATNYVWAIGIPLIVGNYVLADNLCSWFLGDGYVEVPLMTRIMSVRFVASSLSQVFSNQFFIAVGKEKYSSIAMWAAAVLNFLLNLWFVPIMGAVGAAITTAISEVLVTIILIVLMARTHYLNMKPVFLSSVKKIIAAAIMGVVIFFLQRIMPFAIWSFMVLVLVGLTIYGAVLLIERDAFTLSMLSKVRGLLKKIRNKRPETPEN